MEKYTELLHGFSQVNSNKILGIIEMSNFKATNTANILI